MFIEKEPLEVVTSTVRLPITQQGEKVRILFTLKMKRSESKSWEDNNTRSAML